MNHQATLKTPWQDSTPQELETLRDSSMLQVLLRPLKTHHLQAAARLANASRLPDISRSQDTSRLQQFKLRDPLKASVHQEAPTAQDSQDSRRRRRHQRSRSDSRVKFACL
jgi:hypothetical protein